MDGLHRLQKDTWARASIVLLFVLALLALGAIFAQPAHADLGDEVIDQTTDVVETIVPPAEDEANDAAPAEEVKVEDVPPFVEDVLEVVGDGPPVVEDVLEVVGDGPPVVEEVVEVADDVSVVEDVLEAVEDVAPVVEVLEAVPPAVEIVEDVMPSVFDVVVVVPMQVVDVLVLPPFVPAAPESPGTIATTAVPVPTISNTPEVSLTSAATRNQSQQPSGLFSKELIAEMTMLQLADLTTGSTANTPSAPSLPDQKAPPMAAYVPVAGTVPVVGGAGASSSGGASHSASSSFGLDAFGFFAAMAALLALCLVGWIRDRSRSGRSIYPSHGGRPG